MNEKTPLQNVAEWLWNARNAFQSVEIVDSDLSEMKERLQELWEDIHTRAQEELEQDEE